MPANHEMPLSHDQAPQAVAAAAILLYHHHPYSATVNRMLVDQSHCRVLWHEVTPKATTAEVPGDTTCVFLGNLPKWTSEGKVFWLLLHFKGILVSRVEAMRNPATRRPTGSFCVYCSAADAITLCAFDRKAYCTPDYVRYHKEWRDSDLEAVRNQEMLHQQGRPHMPKNLLTVALSTGPRCARGQKKHGNGIKADPAPGASHVEVATTTTPLEEHKQNETPKLRGHDHTTPPQARHAAIDTAPAISFLPVNPDPSFVDAVLGFPGGALEEYAEADAPLRLFTQLALRLSEPEGGATEERSNNGGALPGATNLLDTANISDLVLVLASTSDRATDATEDGAAAIVDALALGDEVEINAIIHAAEVDDVVLGPVVQALRVIVVVHEDAQRYLVNFWQHCHSLRYVIGKRC